MNDPEYYEFSFPSEEKAIAAETIIAFAAHLGEGLRLVAAGRAEATRECLRKHGKFWGEEPSSVTDEDMWPEE